MTIAPEIGPVLFIHAPCWGTMGPPTGAACVSGYLQANGIPLEVCDLNVEFRHHLGPDHGELWRAESYRTWELMPHFRQQILPLMESWLGAEVERLAELKPAVACFSTSVSNVLCTMELARRLKLRVPGLRNILGGPQMRFSEGALHLPPGLQRPCRDDPGVLDAVVLGEGERTTLELVQRALAGRPLKGIAGAVTLDDGAFGRYLPRPEVEHLDDLGWPSFEGYQLDRYDQRFLPLILSRGCRNRCRFCNEHVQQDTLQFRDGAKVFEEVCEHQDRYGTEIFIFADLTVTSAMDELLRFSDQIIASGRRIKWSAQASPVRHLTNPDIARRLRQSGCDYLNFGIESFSSRVLGLMSKPFSLGQAEEVLRVCHEAGIGTEVNLVIGFPGETEQDLQVTLDGLSRNAPHITTVVSVAECLIAPAAELERLAPRLGVELPERGQFMHWRMPGNTHEVRLQRVIRTLKYIRELGLTVDRTHQYDENLSAQKSADRRTNRGWMQANMDLPAEPSEAGQSFAADAVQEGASPHPLPPAPRHGLRTGASMALLLGKRGLELWRGDAQLTRGPGIILDLNLGKGEHFGSCDTPAIQIQRPDSVLLFWDQDTATGSPAGTTETRLFMCISVAQPCAFDLEVSAEVQDPGPAVRLRAGLCLHALLPAPAPAQLLFSEESWQPERERDIYLEAITHWQEATLPRDQITARLQLSVPPSETPLIPERSGGAQPAILPPASSDGPALELAQVRLLPLVPNRGLTDGRYLAQGQGLRLLLWIYCRAQVPSPLVRFQLHDHNELLLVGLNNYRAGVTIPTAAGSLVRVDALLTTLPLAPGSYLASIALCSGEGGDAEVYALRETAYDVHVAGSPGPTQAPLIPPDSWMEPFYPPEEEWPGPGIRVRPMPGAPVERGTLAAGQPLDLELDIPREATGMVEPTCLELQLSTEAGRELAWWRVDLPPGDHRCLRFHTGDLRLLQGQYRLLLRRPTAPPHEGSFSFGVHSPLDAGGGILHAPFTMAASLVCPPEPSPPPGPATRP